MLLCRDVVLASTVSDILHIWEKDKMINAPVGKTAIAKLIRKIKNLSFNISSNKITTIVICITVT